MPNKDIDRYGSSWRVSECSRVKYNVIVRRELMCLILCGGLLIGGCRGMDCRSPKYDSVLVTQEKLRYAQIVRHPYPERMRINDPEVLHIVKAANTRNRWYARLRAIGKSAVDTSDPYRENLRQRIRKLQGYADSLHCLHLLEIDHATRPTPRESLRPPSLF